MTADDEPTGNPLHRAFDELRFGTTRTLNLRALQPTASQAAQLAEQWLRSKQMEGPGDTLIVTGRGNRSVDGYSPVREAIVKLLPSLRRRNVIQSFAEHTPGSFVVTLASVRALFEVPKRRRESTKPTPPSTPAALIALDPETLGIMRELATIALSALGIVSPTRAMIEDEMCRQFAQLSAGLPANSDREATLQQAALRALEEFELG
jgi:hypothetical protein